MLPMAEGENATTSRKLKHSWQIYEENRKLRPRLDDYGPRQSEDDQQREAFGPRGVSGKRGPAKMVPQRRKKTPTDFDSRPHGLSPDSEARVLMRQSQSRTFRLWPGLIAGATLVERI
jgi:hypothetical protein